jgi:phosphoribosylanthranilate isomerase
LKVKVCGITSYEDAAAVVEAGADALGFNFYPASPRYVDPLIVRGIVRRLSPFATAVGVFVNMANTRALTEIVRFSGVQVLQLHGDESPDYCRELQDWPLIKAIRPGGGLDCVVLSEYPVQAFLLDARDEGHYGGTGKTFDWTLATGIKGIRPVILAGGLTPENVAHAIQAVQPYAVDVCSGVEAMPGKKDPAKLLRFMEEVRHACFR